MDLGFGQVLAKLKETILPEAKRMLGKVGKGEGSNYPSSIAKVQELQCSIIVAFLFLLRYLANASVEIAKSAMSSS